MTSMAVAARLARLDWLAIEEELWSQGFAVAPAILTPAECASLIALYVQEDRFRKTIDMEKHRFGRGEYKYFRYPLPPLVRLLRVQLYRRLAPIANRWMDALRTRRRYPATLKQFLAECAASGQTRPTPLVLRYQPGGYNCLHQDLYGEVAFPLQVTAFLSRPGIDHQGGAFLLLEQRPRAQSMCDALMPKQGSLVLFANAIRPAIGKRGYRRVQLKHGVARLQSGRRYTLGVIFHDAK
jgi:uncharacterized protein